MRFTQKAFTLIEILITFTLLGVIISLLVPRFAQLKRNSIIQNTRNQAAALQTAVNAWVVNLPSTDDFGIAAANPTIDPRYFTGSRTPVITDYLDSSFMTNSDGSSNIIVSTGTSSRSYLSTSNMRQLTGQTFTSANAITISFQNINVSVYPEPVNYAHVVIYWYANSSVRKATNPIVVLFIPNP